MGFDFTLRADPEAPPLRLSRPLGGMLLAHPVEGYECDSIQRTTGVPMAVWGTLVPQQPGAGPWRAPAPLRAESRALLAACRAHHEAVAAIQVMVVDPDYFSSGAFTDELAAVVGWLEGPAAQARQVRLTAY